MKIVRGTNGRILFRPKPAQSDTEPLPTEGAWKETPIISYNFKWQPAFPDHSERIASTVLKQYMTKLPAFVDTPHNDLPSPRRASRRGHRRKMKRGK